MISILLNKKMLAVIPLLFLCACTLASQPDTPYVQHFPRGNTSSIDSFRGSVDIDKDFYLGKFPATKGQYVLTPGWRGLLDTVKVSTMVGTYSPVRVDLTIGVDIEANTPGITPVPVALIPGSKFFRLEDNDILSIVVNNLPDQQAAVVNTNKIDFTASGGIFSGTVTILYRHKL